MVAIAPGDGRGNQSSRRKPWAGGTNRCIEPCEKVAQDAAVDGGIADDTRASCNLGAPCLELRLDESDDPAASTQQPGGTWKDEPERDEGDIYDSAVGALRQRGEVADVGTIHNHDTGIGPQRPRELPMPDINGIDALGVVSKQHVRETTCGGADVQTNVASGIEDEGIEGAFKLEATAAGIAQLGGWSDQLTGRLARDTRAGLIHHLSVDTNLARHDERAGPFAAGCQTMLDEENIQTLATWSGARAPVMLVRRSNVVCRIASGHDESVLLIAAAFHRSV